VSLYYYWLALLFAQRQRVAIQSGVNDSLVLDKSISRFPRKFIRTHQRRSTWQRNIPPTTLESILVTNM
jgi:hypothetical protein